MSRSVFAIVDDRDRAYFGGVRTTSATSNRREVGAVFGRTYAAEPDILIKQLKPTAMAKVALLLLTVPNQVGVEHNAHVIEAILTHVAPAFGWR